MNREWRTWATRVRVTVEQTFVHPAGGQPERVVLFTILNRSDHAVNITRLGMEPITRGGESIFFPSRYPPDQARGRCHHTTQSASTRRSGLSATASWIARLGRE